MASFSNAFIYLYSNSAPQLPLAFSLHFTVLPPLDIEIPPWMQGLRHSSNDVVHLNVTASSSATISMSSSFSIDLDESAEIRIQRLISEHPVIIFSRSSCCMCHVIKKLLATIGVHPTVIELDDHEISALPLSSDDDGQTLRNRAPAVFIGGTCIGGLESLVALHLSGRLVPKLVEIGALWV